MPSARCQTWALLIAAAIGMGPGFQPSPAMAQPVPGDPRTSSVRWDYELQRDRAHQRMENTMYASTPARGDEASMCPALAGGQPSLHFTLDGRGSFWKSDTRKYSAKTDVMEPESAQDFFLNHISGPIVQAKCVNCHVEGGLSGHTRLVFQPSSNPDHAVLNLAMFKDFLAKVEDGANRILNKIQGVAHGGGIQVPAGSDDFANMERLFALLGYGEDSGPDLSPETLFDTVIMTSPGKTLWRTALIFGGRIPTQEEREAVDNGTDEDLRAAIQSLMTGPGFHQFLIRASNDRLLTDRHLGYTIEDTQPRFVDFVNLSWAKKLAAIEKGHSDPHQDGEFIRWWHEVQYGFGRAPIELIAHVVENDLPYTEVLTADYIMANPMASEAYGASTQFDDSEDPLEFRPSEIVSYYRDDESKVSEYDFVLGNRVFDPGNLWTDYPHAGILNTPVFLLRYPTTPTNRNRARSRWTYYHFLALDIEKSAARTTDPDALADTDNPTMNNPACTVCHRVMDPVAGTYQNYGEDGHYRDAWGGLDSLAEFYKEPPDGSYTPYQHGDAWYRDMREPGFDGLIAPDADNSVQWLAEQIVADDRFAEGTVKFWWPAIMGVEVVEPPEDKNDSDFKALLLASNAQTAEVERLAEAFRTGIAGGEPYNLKDLLVEITLSPWFRAESLAYDNPVRAAALSFAGVERLLTPEELAWKTQAITGYGWGRGSTSPWDLSNGDSGGYISQLTNLRFYRLLYGGIDSDGITERTDDMTAIMASVAQSHAVESSCPIVQREFLFWPDEDRRLFSGIDKNVSPVWETSGSAVIEADSWRERETNSWTVELQVGSHTLRLRYANNYWNPETETTRNLILDEVVVRDPAGAVVSRVELETLPEVTLWDKPEDEREGCEGWPHYNESIQRNDGYAINWCHSWLDIPISTPTAGSYQIEVVAFQSLKVPDEEDAILEIMVESDIDTSRGAMLIRNKLVELHEKLLGVTVTADSPEVEALFLLFVEVWERKRLTDDWQEEHVTCDISDMLYFEGIADGIVQEYATYDGGLYHDFNWDRVGEIQDEAGWWGQEGLENPVIQSWTVVMAYFMTDYRYLFL